MLLKPHEILNHLGFDIGEDGVETNDFDAFFETRTLQLLGATINVDGIPEEHLKGLHAGMAGLVAMQRNEEIVEWSDQSADRLKATIRANLSVLYKFESKWQGE